MALTAALEAAVSGLQSSQQGLNLASNNITNVNTTGYTRQVFSQQSMSVQGVGMGVTVLPPGRVVDQNLMASIRQENSTLNTLQTTSDYYTNTQNLFGAPGSQTSISASITALSQNLESLALNPNTPTSQSNAVQSATQMTQQLNSMSAQIQNLRLQSDQALSSSVSQANGLLAQVAALNNKIVQADNTGQNSSTLEDSRDQALQQLSGMMDIQTFTRSDGAVTIYTNSGLALVDNTAVTLTHPAVSAVNPQQTLAGGGFSGIYIGSTDISNQFQQGKIAALVTQRDNTLPNLQSQLDQLTTAMAAQVNAVHNQGTSYPALTSSMTGTTTFMPLPTALAPTAQTITLGSGDVAINIFDKNGTQVASTTLNGIMMSDMSNVGGQAATPSLPGPPSPLVNDDKAQASNGPWTLDQITRHLQGWLHSSATDNPPGPGLTAATVSLNDNNGNFTGNLAIDLNSPSYGLAFQDQAFSTPGSAPQPATIQFNADGHAQPDPLTGKPYYTQTVQGFSNFFGLNNLLNTSATNARTTWDSTIIPNGATMHNLGVGATANLTFSDATNGINIGNYGIQVLPSDTLSTIASRINGDATLGKIFQASVVPNGGGSQLRIQDLTGANMMVSQNNGTGIQNALQMAPTTAGASASVAVRPDIIGNPQLISRGMVQYSNDTKTYSLSAGDNTIANALAKTFTNTTAFASAGGIGNTNLTFTDYASTIISQNATAASTVQQNVQYQTGLTTALSQKSSSENGVNLDQELANIMMYQQSYAAAAKVITTSTAMMDTLESLFR
ncbi:MAG: flagellar hook-associated protein FlgK [Alphaproteobacteria bacterium]|nr:flagellar hook-associated protein FlgK [Alphaproteobacteria bacterium]